MFGAARGILLMALFVIGGQFAGFDNDDWWLQSRLLPRFAVVADWIKVMAPKGYELLMPDEKIDSLPIDVPEKLPNPGLT
jgi:membrane protein required for colicin V production